MWQTITINYKKMKIIEVDMDNLDKLPEVLENIFNQAKKTESKASADWKNYETACGEPKIPAPKFKVWSEVVFEFENYKYPVYLKITSMFYHEKTWTWIYNYTPGEINKSYNEEDLRHATLPEVIKYFRP